MYQLKWIEKNLSSIRKGQKTRCQKIEFASYTIENKERETFEAKLLNGVLCYNKNIIIEKKINFVVKNCYYSFDAKNWEVQPQY